MRNKFIRGDVKPGTIGGNQSAILTLENIPSHTHSFTIPQLQLNGGTGSSNKTNGPQCAAGASNCWGERWSSSWQYTGFLTTGSTGNGQPFSIIPQFFSVIYIQRFEGYVQPNK